MSTYFVECYWPGVDEQELTNVVERLMTTPRDEESVAWITSILVLEDEIVLCVAQGPSADALRASAQRAGLPVERVVQCLQIVSPAAESGLEAQPPVEPTT